MSAADLEERVTRAVLAKIAAALGAAAQPTYSSRKGHGPPGYGHRAWQQLAKQIGTKRGRWYVVSAAELADYEGRQAAPELAPVIRGPWSPSEALSRAGLRGSR